MGEALVMSAGGKALEMLGMEYIGECETTQVINLYHNIMIPRDMINEAGGYMLFVRYNAKNTGNTPYHHLLTHAFYIPTQIEAVSNATWGTTWFGNWATMSSGSGAGGGTAVVWWTQFNAWGCVVRRAGTNDLNTGPLRDTFKLTSAQLFKIKELPVP